MYSWQYSKIFNWNHTYFGKFRAINDGRILDLSCNAVELYTIQYDLENQANSHKCFMVEILFKDDSYKKYRND